MGHQTVRHVPRTLNYKEALYRFESIKPIRNLVPERKPLGQRRDHHTYWVRKNPQTNAVEYMLYRTPVITFNPDDSIEIRSDGYSTVSTHGFIMHVLGYANIRANGYTNKTKLEVGSEVLIIGSGDVARLVWGENKQLRFAQEVPDQYQYNMDRAAANNVRRKYKEFADYLEGFMNLRTTMEVFEYVGWRAGQRVVDRKERAVIEIPIFELVEALGVDKSQNGTQTVASGVMHWATPATQGHYKYKEITAHRVGQEQKILSLIASDQPEEIKHQNFYKAALAFATVGRNIFANPGAGQRTAMSVKPEDMREFFKSGLIMAHAREVLTLTKLPRGRVPSRKYRGWVIDESDWAERKAAEYDKVKALNEGGV